MKAGHIKNNGIWFRDLSTNEEPTSVTFYDSLKITPTEIFNKLYDIKDLEKSKQKEMLIDFVFQAISDLNPRIKHYKGPLTNKQEEITWKDIGYEVLDYIRRLDLINLLLRFIRKGAKLVPTTTISGYDVLSPGEVGVRLEIGFSATKDTNSLFSRIGFCWYREGGRYHRLILPNLLANLRSLHNILSEELKKHYSQIAAIESTFDSTSHRINSYIKLKIPDINNKNIDEVLKFSLYSDELYKVILYLT